MPDQCKLQANRFEFKYIVDESCAAAVRHFALGYLQPDPYADPQRGNSYQLSSLYLDTPSLLFYHQTVAGEKNRRKLRIRLYDNNPRSPALLEIKRRISGVVLKERAVVTRDGVRELLDGMPPRPAWLLRGEQDKKSGDAMYAFCQLRDQTGAGPSIYVSYRREAYVSPRNNAIRVTFDRDLMGSVYEKGAPLMLPEKGAYPEVGNANKVILELKFTDRFPRWMHDLVQVFGIERTSVPKYILCIDTMARQRMIAAVPARDSR